MFISIKYALDWKKQISPIICRYVLHSPGAGMENLSPPVSLVCDVFWKVIGCIITKKNPFCEKWVVFGLKGRKKVINFI